MLAFKEVKRYRDRTITAYGASQINEYLSNTYPDGVCPLCTNLETENGGVPPYLNMFEEYVLAGSLNDELSSASFMLSMPISEFPLFQFARLLQPGVNVVGAIENHIYVCPNNAYNLIQLANCLYEQQLAMDMVNPLVETIISLNPSAPVNVVTGMEGDLMSGYANLVINKKYQEVMLLAYVNCLNNIYDVCWSDSFHHYFLQSISYHATSLEDLLIIVESYWGPRYFISYKVYFIIGLIGRKLLMKEKVEYLIWAKSWSSKQTDINLFMLQMV